MLSAIEVDATECRSNALLQRSQHRIRDVVPMLYSGDHVRHGRHIGHHSAKHVHGFKHSTETQSWQIYLVAVALWLGILVVLINWRWSSDFVARGVANVFQRFSRVPSNAGHESTLGAHDDQRAIQNEKIGIVASLFAQRNAASEAGAQDIQDSMGQMRMVSQRGRLEMKVIFQMYIVGVLAVTLIHWTWYATSLMGELTPSLQLLVAFLTQNKWHLQLFFAGAAYLDRDQPLNFRDLIPFVFVFVLPVMYWLPIVPKNHVFATSWYGLGHPARWFFLCRSASRLFSLSLKASGSSKLVHILLAAPYACLWPYICICVHSFATPGSWSDIACIWLGVGIPKIKIVNKLIASTMTYLVFLNIMPTAIDFLALAGPKTRNGEIRLGSFLWLLLTAWIVFDLRVGSHQLESYEMRVMIPFSSLMHNSWYLPFPIGLPFAWIRIGLLGAALIYLPFTAVPESALHSLLGALLLMPFVLHASMVHTISSCLHHTASSLGQLIVLVLFFCSFLVILAPLCQTFVLHASRGCFKLFSKLANV